MLAKKSEIPISLKVSYADELELKLAVPQKFQIQKFARHWIMMGGFHEYQEQQITKKYLSYLNEGDLVKIKGNYIKSDWKQKNVRKYDDGNENEIQNFFSFEFSIPYKEDQYKYFQESIQIQILKKLTNFYQQDMKQQMGGLKVITIFLNLDSDNPLIIKILDLIRDSNNSNVLVNLFVNEIPTLHENRYNFINKWVSFYSLLNFQTDLRFMFFTLSKITVKKISLYLKCFDGELSRRNLKSKKRTYSEWNLQNNDLSYQMNFPQSNKIYINIIQFRNLGYRQCYKFELILDCIDVNDNSFHSKKSFQLKPRRQEFESITGLDYHAENQMKIKAVFKIEQSLKCDCVEIFDKIENLKHVCERIQIEIKNNMNFNQNSDQEEENIKMLHSFEI